SGGKQLRMLTKDLRQMLAEARRIGHARCVGLFTIERHTETLSSGWFHSSDSPYGAVCSIHSIGLEVESSYCLYRFPPTTKSDGIRKIEVCDRTLVWHIFNRLRVFRSANTAHLGRGVGQERWWRVGLSEKYAAC